jgi:thiosulfate dehydrogenase
MRNTLLVRAMVSATLCIFASFAPTESSADTAIVSAQDATLVKRGHYVSLLGDCVACHTADKGPAMAGGRELATPFGLVYSSNITPDPQTGIGRYTFEQFDSAMRRGIAADGHNLYPAMPYPSYAKMKRSDMRALYAYLQHGVAPVALANKPAEMHWPFSMRWGLSIWNWAFLDSTRYKRVKDEDAVWNRGAYLVEGLGHCGSCHTPRGIAFQEKATSAAGANGKFYLAGETLEAWRALSLRNLWTIDDTVRVLKTGQGAFGTVTGSMVEVIHRSTQHFTDDDLVAIATYLKSLPRGENDSPMAPPPVHEARATPGDMFATRGGLGYVQFCMGCHRQDGMGVSEIFPPLANNHTVASPDPATLLHVTLTGWKTAETGAHPRVFTMPAFAPLSDQELAEILTFVRSSWGSSGKPVAAADVKAMRSQLDPKFAASKFETPRFADMLASPNADALLRGMRLHIETRSLLPQKVGNTLNCTSCHLNAGTVADGSPFVGVSAFFPSYAPRAGRVITLADRINGCFLRSMHGKPLPPDSADMKAMVAYFDWMKRETKPDDKVFGRGVGTISPAIKPDVENGKRVYAQQCAACHGRDGEGLKEADGRVIYPPLWGDASFNIGAGMARTYTAAAFVKRNMPIAASEKFPLGQGALSDQEAVDVAEYFSHQLRPDFPDKVKDWPRDKKPSDARY